MSSIPDTALEDLPTTATRILDCAQERIQRRGYNAVSYGDLAADGPTLPTEVRHEVRQLFADQEDCLMAIIGGGAPERAGLQRGDDYRFGARRRPLHPHAPVPRRLGCNGTAPIRTHCTRRRNALLWLHVLTY